MKQSLDLLVRNLAAYGPYTVLSGLWLAYVGGGAPWIGGASGLAVVVLLTVPVLVVRRRTRHNRRDRLLELLEG